MANIIKNPIVIGLLVGVIIYLYLYWEEDKRRKKNPESKKKPVNIVTPGVVAAIVWFVASSYLDYKSNTSTSIGAVKNTNQMVQSIDQDNIIKLDANHGESLHRIEKNSIRLPPTDVFIDMIKF